MLPALAVVDIEIGRTRPEIAHLTAHAARVADPNVQTKTHLEDSRKRAFARIGPAQFQMVRHSERSDAAPEADPGRNRGSGKSVATKRRRYEICGIAARDQVRGEVYFLVWADDGRQLKCEASEAIAHEMAPRINFEGETFAQVQVVVEEFRVQNNRSLTKVRPMMPVSSFF